MVTNRRKRGGKKCGGKTTPPLELLPIAPASPAIPTAQASELSEFLPPTFLQLRPDDTVGSMFGRTLGEIILATIKYRWKQVAPISYQINRTTNAVAPQLPAEQKPALDLIALATGAYGLSRVFESEC